jgi:hypothetical protein
MTIVELTMNLLSVVLIVAANILYVTIRNKNILQEKQQQQQPQPQKSSLSSEPIWIQQQFCGIFTFRTWKLLHGMAQVAFFFSTVGGSGMEFLSYTVGGSSHYVRWMIPVVIPYLEAFVAMPSVALATISGVALATIRLWNQPRSSSSSSAQTHHLDNYHKQQQKKKTQALIERSLQLLVVFGLYWLIVDKLWTQGHQNVMTLKNFFFYRTLANIGSCILALMLWLLMKQIRRSSTMMRRHHLSNFVQEATPTTANSVEKKER